MQELFRKIAVYVSRSVGSIWAIFIFITLVLTTGILYHFSSEWENLVSFIISIITLLVLFFLQKSQNHDDKATHLKLDELIRAIEGARNEVVSVEERAEMFIDELKEDIKSEH